MSKVESEAEAKQLNESGEYGPYRAANGHLMVAELIFPKVDADNPLADPVEREYRVGDEIRYYQWSAGCHSSCNHSELGQLEDW